MDKPAAGVLQKDARGYWVISTPKLAPVKKGKKKPVAKKGDKSDKQVIKKLK